MAKVMPVLMIALSLGAAGVYSLGKDWRHVAYWLCAAGITASVTF